MLLSPATVNAHAITPPPPRKPNGAFTLVELSIVLVILGLLVGGVLAGQSLIRAAELRAVHTDLGKYATAYYLFRDKYFQIPGDMSNAVIFWGAADSSTGETAACPTTDSLTLANKKLTCNGDGNGRIENITQSNEIYRQWQHLANAGLVEGTFSGIAGATNGGLPGYNIPLSKMNKLAIGSGWWPSGDPSGTYSGSTYDFDGYYGNVYTVQGPRDATFTPPQARIMRPQEMWNIDTKMDDGKPATGKVVVHASNDLADCTSTAVTTDLTATYLLSETSKLCGLIFRQQF